MAAFLSKKSNQQQRKQMKDFFPVFIERQKQNIQTKRAEFLSKKYNKGQCKRK